MKYALPLLAALLLAPPAALHAADEDLALNYHLVHPGGDSLPGDPNAAFCLDGTYHLHYIIAHPWKEKKSFAFVHVTSPDMLHWTWQPTKLQPSFTGHGMFSGFCASAIRSAAAITSATGTRRPSSSFRRAMAA